MREYRLHASAPDFGTVHTQVLSYVIYGTCIVVIGLFVLLLISYQLLGNDYVKIRILACLPLLLSVLFAWYFLKKGFTTIAAWMALGLYAMLALGILWFWSINTPIGVLLLGFIIVLSGLTLGSRVVLPVTLGVLAMMFFVQLATDNQWTYPDYSTFLRPPQLSDVVSYIVFFAVFGLVSWIASLKMEQLLTKRLAAEKELRRQKRLVSKQLRERTRALQEAQLRETKYLYGFAELGQLSTALLHDLSNHLTVLSLEIEGLEQQKHSQAITRAQKSIQYLDEMVEQVRVQIREGGNKHLFDVPVKIQHVIASLQSKAQSEGVFLRLEVNQNAKGVQCYGDPVRFCYIMTILLTNAIDAYNNLTATKGEVRIIVAQEHTKIIIQVLDWGVGVAAKEVRRIFNPFCTTKSDGMGIGLFIVKEILAVHFRGVIKLQKRVSPTIFCLQLPVSVKGRHGNTLS